MPAVFANNASGIVTSGGTTAPASGSFESWTVSPAAGFPASLAAGQYFHVADPAQPAEKILVTAISGSGPYTWTVTRGDEGIAPVAHSSSFTVFQVITAGDFSSLTPLVAPSGDTTGATDHANIQALVGAGTVARLASGNYYLNADLTFANNGAVTGTGIGSTTVWFASGYTGTALFNMTGALQGYVRDLLISGQSTNYAANPAGGGVYIAHSNGCTVQNVVCNYVNGWGFQVISDATGDSYKAVLDNIRTYQCTSGCLLQGTNSTDHNQETFISNCDFEDCQLGDGLKIIDVHDITIVNLAGYCNNGSGGVPLHIAGQTAALYISGIDLGPQNANQPCVLIESSGGNAPRQVNIENGIIEGCTPGISITAGSLIKLRDLDIFANQSDGIDVSGASDVEVSGCTFRQNGQTAGTHYDVKWTSTGTLLCHHNTFSSPQGTGAGQVTQPVYCSGGNTYITDNWVAGAGMFASGSGYATYTRGNINYNPVGPLGAPAIPASGTPFTNGRGVDCTVYVAAGASACAVAINAVTVVTVPASGVCAVRLQLGETITLTYTSAPTWGWTGD